MVVAHSVLVLDCARAKHASLAIRKNSNDLMLNIYEWLKREKKDTVSTYEVLRRDVDITMNA